jgi:hypothetical protein
MRATFRDASDDPGVENLSIGFRVAGFYNGPPSAVPEPTIAMLWLVGGMVLWRYRQRR